MAINFPTSLDVFTDPTASDQLNLPSHSGQHTDLNNAVEALEAKVGINSSAVTSSHDYKIAQLEARTEGKILQVVRATDSTNRSTTSGALVDASISVTITPTSASSNVLLIWSSRVSAAGGNPEVGQLVITDSSNVAISGAESCHFGNNSTDDTYNTMVLVGFDSPATTSATTYKGRFSAFAPATVLISNANATGQMIAMEIGA